MLSQADDVCTNFAWASSGAYIPRGHPARTSSRLRHQVHEPGVASALGDVTYLGLDRNGQVDACDVGAAIIPDTVLVSVVHASNETGTIQPSAGIARDARTAGLLLHVDAAQSAGKIVVDVVALGADLLTVVGPSCPPRRDRALHVRRGIQLRPLIGGCGQGHGLWAGTENVAAAIGSGEAAELAPRSLAGGESRDCASCATAPCTTSPPCSPARPGPPQRTSHRALPNTANIRIDGVTAVGLLADLTDVVISAGSACHSGRDEPSSVPTAIGLPRTSRSAHDRLSLGLPHPSDDNSASIPRTI